MTNTEFIAGIGRTAVYSLTLVAIMAFCQTAQGQAIPGDPCVLGADTDCDGVAQACDICLRGDDSVDANNDGIADCAQLLDYDDYADEWKCGDQKLLICHIPLGNPNNMETICVDMDGVLEHVVEHGDPIGPCTCLQQGGGRGEGQLPDGEDPKGEARMASPIPAAQVFPNPASDITNISTMDTPDRINVYNYMGVLVASVTPNGNNTRLDVSGSHFMNGIYVLEILQGGDRTVERLLVAK